MPAQIDEVPPAVRSVARVAVLTIGGNDFQFKQIVLSCLLQPFTFGDCGNRLSADEDRIPAVVSTTKTALLTLAREMPQAQIVLVGYPALTSPRCVQSPFNGTIATLQKALNTAQATMIGAINRVQRTTRFHYASMYDLFLGHGPCAFTASQRYINKGVLPPWASFHPNKAGNDAIAAELLRLFGGFKSSTPSAPPSAATQILHTLDLNFATGSVTLDGVVFRPVSNLGGRFDQDPRNFLGTSDGCADSPGSSDPASSSPHRGSIAWSAPNPAQDPSIEMFFVGGQPGCDLATSLIDHIQVHSWFTDLTIRVRTDLGSFNLGENASTLPAQLIATMSLSGGVFYHRCINPSQEVTIWIENRGAGAPDDILAVWVDGVWNTQC
jgi:hypothetical protein